MSSGVLTDIELQQVEALSTQVEKLTTRRDEMRGAWSKLRSVAAGSTPNGFRTFQTLASLGAQLRSVERRIDGILDGTAT